MKRRTFLQLGSMTAAAAWLSGCRSANEKLVPYLNPPDEGVTPGKAFGELDHLNSQRTDARCPHARCVHNDFRLDRTLIGCDASHLAAFATLDSGHARVGVHFRAALFCTSREFVCNAARIE